MTSLHLFIPDLALCEALVEQINAAKIGEPRLAETAQALLRQIEGIKGAGVGVDDAGKNIASLIETLAERPEKPTILMLGGTDDTEGVSETFAKPLRLGHLITRLRYYLETAPLLRERLVSFGPYRLEPQKRRLLYDKAAEPIRLTEKETALLVFLADCAEPVTRRDILAAIWGYDERIDTHTLETHIYQLRRKLDGDQWLVNEAGAYRLARGLS